jgi:hypothetical protein
MFVGEARRLPYRGALEIFFTIGFLLTQKHETGLERLARLTSLL